MYGYYSGTSSWSKANTAAFWILIRPVHWYTNTVFVGLGSLVPTVGYRIFSGRSCYTMERNQWYWHDFKNLVAWSSSSSMKTHLQVHQLLPQAPSPLELLFHQTIFLVAAATAATVHLRLCRIGLYATIVPWWTRQRTRLAFIENNLIYKCTQDQVRQIFPVHHPALRHFPVRRYFAVGTDFGCKHRSCRLPI